jgi:predicted HTH domain antitoxin
MIKTNVMLTQQQHKTLERRHQAAIVAYREGFISLGKLAESLGVDLLTARSYLKERGIKQMVQGADEIMADADNA